MLKKFGMVVSVVALLTLALVGCKNGMLGEDEATVNGEREAGGRTAKVTITNFAQNGNGATRSVVGGPLRTIAPTVADVKGGNYVFIAEGTNNKQTMDAARVSIDPTTGRVDLSSLTSGIWVIKITAYDKALLQAENVNPDNPGTTVQDILAKVDTCAVLSGSAYVDLRKSNSDVAITLTPHGLGTQGKVTVDLELHIDDQTKIRDRVYNVSLGLYDKVTGAIVDVSDVSLVAQAGTTISYGPYTADVGEYIFKMIITDPTNTNGPWYWSDNLIVEGNRETNGDITLSKLIGEAPKEPTNFAVYWDSTKVDSTQGEFTATFAWDRQSFNEENFELQIFDLTEKYEHTGQMMYDGQQFTNATDLWRHINDEVTGVLNKENQFSTSYPIWAKDGNLLAGSTKTNYRLKTGHVYVFRIRSSNVNGKSNWVNMMTTPGQLPASGPTVIASVSRFDKEIVNLFTITYNLQDSFVIAEENQQIDRAKIETNSFPVAYNPAQPYSLTLLPKGIGVTSYLLFKKSATGTANDVNSEYVSGWTGWREKNNPALEFIQGKTTYDKWSDIELITIGGASSNSAMIDVISAGTYAELLNDATRVLVKTNNLNTPTTWQDTDKLSGKATDVSSTTVGFGKIGNDYALNLKTGGDDTKYLLFSVGEDIAGGGPEEGKMKDAEGREFKVSKVELSLEQNGWVTKSAIGTPQGVIDLTGLMGGNYTLRVYAYNEQGYRFSYQTELIIKYDDELIRP